MKKPANIIDFLEPHLGSKLFFQEEEINQAKSFQLFKILAVLKNQGKKVKQEEFVISDLEKDVIFTGQVPHNKTIVDAEVIITLHEGKVQAAQYRVVHKVTVSLDAAEPGIQVEPIFAGTITAFSEQDFKNVQAAFNHLYKTT